MNNSITVSTNQTKALLYKELKLALHPTCLIFLALATMICIPNYPLYVTFFYTTLGIFFTCLSGRENHDIFFTLMLPINKSQVVNARFLLIVIIELVQLLLAAIVSIFRTVVLKIPNAAGMDPNFAFFGFSFILFGVYNLVFFTTYYKNTDKIGKSFAISSTIVFLYIIVIEVCTFIIPFFHNTLDTLDPANLSPKLIIFAIGILCYVLLTIIAKNISIKNFNKADF